MEKLLDKLRLVVSSFSREDGVSIFKSIPNEFQLHPLRTSAILLFCAFTAVPVASFVVFLFSSVVFTIIVATFWEAVLLLFALVLLLMVLLCTTCLASFFTGLVTVAYFTFLVAYKAVDISNKAVHIGRKKPPPEEELEMSKED